VRVVTKCFAVMQHETSFSADLGFSSHYSRENQSLEGRSWRRVSYQQQMDTSEPFLNYGGNLLITNMVE
jgi:hypothetical protein